jgi:sugar phosphate isomerase/epimerase
VTVFDTTFRLGSTSYIWPAGILPNVRQLGPLVDDVELVLFEVDGHSNIPDTATVGELNALARIHDLTYTVHLPLDLALAHPPSLNMAEKVIASTRDLSPWAYVLHVDGRAVQDRPAPAELSRWHDDAGCALQAIADMVGDARRLCVENLENYPPEYLLPLLDRIPVSLCVDVGHLWLTGRNPLVFLDGHLDRTRVVHLHGIGRRDHQSLCHQESGQVASVLDTLSAHCYDGVLTLEVFGHADFYSSRALIAEMVNGKQ